MIVPAHKGQLDILPGHAPLVSTLTAGILKVKEKGSQTFKSAAIGWGYMEVNPEGVVVLADHADWPEEIDPDFCQKAYDAAAQRLQEAGLSPDEKILEQRKLDFEKAKLDVLQ